MNRRLPALRCEFRRIACEAVDVGAVLKGIKHREAHITARVKDIANGRLAIIAVDWTRKAGKPFKLRTAEDFIAYAAHVEAKPDTAIVASIAYDVESQAQVKQVRERRAKRGSRVVSDSDIQDAINAATAEFEKAIAARSRPVHQTASYCDPRIHADLEPNVMPPLPVPEVADYSIASTLNFTEDRPQIWQRAGAFGKSKEVDAALEWELRDQARVLRHADKKTGSGRRLLMEYKAQHGFTDYRAAQTGPTVRKYYAGPATVRPSFDANNTSRKLAPPKSPRVPAIKLRPLTGVRMRQAYCGPIETPAAPYGWRIEYSYLKTLDANQKAGKRWGAAWVVRERRVPVKAIEVSEEAPDDAYTVSGRLLVPRKFEHFVKGALQPYTAFVTASYFSTKPATEARPVKKSRTPRDALVAKPRRPRNAPVDAVREEAQRPEFGTPISLVGFRLKPATQCPPDPRIAEAAGAFWPDETVTGPGARRGVTAPPTRARLLADTVADANIDRLKDAQVQVVEITDEFRKVG